MSTKGKDDRLPMHGGAPKGPRGSFLDRPVADAGKAPPPVVKPPERAQEAPPSARRTTSSAVADGAGAGQASLPAGATQVNDAKAGPSLDFVIGLDFGTAFTKCVVRAPTLPGTNAFAVPFDNYADVAMPYLLPSEVRLLENGVYALGAGAGGTRILGLKREIVFARASLSDATRRHIVGCLALVLRHVRRWILSTKAAVIRGRRVSWMLNVGLPAANVDDRALVDLYRGLVSAAWWASTQTGSISVSLVRKAMTASATNLTDLGEINIVPEVAAEVVGYARSAHRNEGLHLLVDAGAGTLDACMFNLHDQGEGDRYSIFTAAVEPLGVERIKKDGSAVQKACQTMIAGVVMHTRKSRYPDSPHWKSGVRLFVCGGGRDLPYYSDRIAAVATQIKAAGVAGFSRFEVPKPRNLEASVSDTQYHRLAVAWGLSFDAINIGTIDVPSNIGDVTVRASQRPNFGDDYNK